MESPWQQQQQQHGDSHRHPRGSLGLFIERSTSAPPLSSSFEQQSGSFMGNDLLDAVTKEYSSMGLNKPSSSLQKAAGGKNDYEQADASSFLQGNYDNYHSHSTSNQGLAIARPLSASGTATTYSSSTVNSERGGNSYSFSNTDAFSRDSPIHLERSQSAAPTFLSPPPGLGGSGVRNQMADPNDFFRRSLSASGGGAGGAVRPAAKTLMDLIQEGIPSDNMSPDGVDVTANPYELVGGGSHSGKNHRNMTGGTMQSSLQQQQVMDYGRRSASPSVPRPSSQLSLASSLQQQAMLQHQLQGSPFDQQAVASPAMSGASMTGGSSLQQQLMREQQFLPQQQQIYQQQQDMGGIRYTTTTSPPLLEQQQLLHQQQYGGMPVRQASPEVQQQGGMFVQMSPHMQQQLRPQQQQQQQVFYGGQQATMQGVQQQQPNIQNLQPHVLPNGQTVYVNTGSTQQQQPHNFGGYTTVQYQAPHQPSPMVHQQMAGEQQGQYVSVVSLQGGGQQVTYWQPNGLAQQQTVRQSGMVSAHGGVPVVLGNMGGPTAIDSKFGGLSRDGKGGRGNATTRRGNTPRGRGEKNVSMTSPLLEEFRSTKTRDWTIHRIEGHVVEFCQDQNGSRFIQQRLEMGNVAEQLLVMQEVLPAIRRLRNDVFGNYVVQKLLDFGTPTMKAEIRDTLEGEMLQLSLQMYGCRVVQKALEALDEDDLPRLLREFHHNVLSFIHDQNGNHVIQKCVEVLNHRAQKAQAIGDAHRAKFLEEQIDFIIDDVLVNAAALSCHPYGCRVLQRILEHCGEQRKMAILDEIMKSHKKLLDDQYGNYVIQHVLQFGREVDRDSILQIVVESGLLGMSRQKFASNVVEKLLKYGNGNQRRAVVREMLKPADDPSFSIDPADGGVSVVLLMVRDAYANYVVQTTLDVVPESDEKQLLLEELNCHTEELRNYTFAKHIVAKLTSLSCGN